MSSGFVRNVIRCLRTLNKGDRKMFGKYFERKSKSGAYDSLVEQFQKEQNLNMRLLDELEHLKMCKSCSSKLSKIIKKYI